MRPRSLIGGAALLALTLGQACLTTPTTSVSPGALPVEDYVPDWSQAGYRFGETPPEHIPTHSILDFGAAPDDGEDDTSAFQAALKALAEVEGPVVLQVPAGRYLLSEILYLQRGHLVLQGEGSGRTTLYFDRPLSKMRVPQRIRDLEKYLRDNDKRVDGEFFSNFSWTGGVIWSGLPTADQIPFDEPGPSLSAPVSAKGGHRGAHKVTVGHAAGFEVGESYVLRWFNAQGKDSAFLQHLYGDPEMSFADRLVDDPDTVLVQQEATVVAKDATTLTLKQPLLHDIREGWKVQLGAAFRLEEVGIEGLRIEFPDQAYGGHHLEAGFNGIHLNDLRHSWVRDVVLSNADSGILSDRSSHVTMTGVKVEGRAGHYGVHLGSVYGVLVEDFFVASGFAHSVSFNTRSAGSVFHRGTIVDGSLDQHRGVNHQNLFDQIIALESDGESRLFDHGGAGYWGPPHGAFNTFWNIEVRFDREGSGPVHLGQVRGAGPARIVGLRANRPVRFDYPSARITESASPPSLFAEQRAARQD